MPDVLADIAWASHEKPVPVSANDKQVLRGLAGKVAELAARPIEKEKADRWRDHNDLRPGRPLIFCDPEHGWEEIVTPEQMQCEGKSWREIERRLRKEIFWGEQTRDDRVIQPSFDVPWVGSFSNWGMAEKNIGGQDGGARRWESPITDLNDLSGLRPRKLSVDKEATQRLRETVSGVFGDLLTVRTRSSWYWSLGLTWELIKLRGLEQMMMDMYDNPAGLHRLMAFLRDGTMGMVDQLLAEGVYSLNNEGDYVGSGGFGWTRELPAAGFNGKVRTADLWCLSESQETVGVSPTMFEEFVFPYQLPLAEKFGRVCYGCCEPLHARWHIVKRIPTLRRVSVSPWADRAKMAEYLGDRYVFSLKPHPALISGDTFDADAIRADVRDALDKAGGCRLEIIMKDNHTLHNDPSRPGKWVALVREEIERRWKA